MCPNFAGCLTPSEVGERCANRSRRSQDFPCLFGWPTLYCGAAGAFSQCAFLSRRAEFLPTEAPAYWQAGGVGGGHRFRDQRSGTSTGCGIEVEAAIWQRGHDDRTIIAKRNLFLRRHGHHQYASVVGALHAGDVVARETALFGVRTSASLVSTAQVQVELRTLLESVSSQVPGGMSGLGFAPSWSL